ncbi:hypothetical protein RBG61_10550 [Paludicola sp. MB14-C6]|uniref:hypothetical protein n=1 Tax=Paludihabitans sp. MB14-C6 TaxID=3070656 RepID=UPI0027DC9DD1|nr:hypothetical protein [Paludicola sp. MB14-C6]WMJ22424.1 hypothetical protein RBG61_10550 [Paludicola sp. MB14-C6]
MSHIIFYSWQNDLPGKTHRYFLDKCIQLSLMSLEKEANVYMDYDRDTMGLMGSPDITESIFRKIDKSAMFVCDISIVNSKQDGRMTPNPNVLIELGYAASKLGWERIICLFDVTTGKIEDLPFDLRQKRITPFNPKSPNEKQRIADILSVNIKDLFVQGKLFNPLNDYMKGKIDKAFLDIGKQLANLMFGTYSLSEGLSHITDLLSLSYETAYDRLYICEFPAFIVLNTFENTEQELTSLLKNIFSSSYFPKEWAYYVLQLLDWIREYSNFSSERNAQFPFEPHPSKRYDDLAVISAKGINPNNPVNAKLVMHVVEQDGKRFIDPVEGRVINTTYYPTSEPSKLGQCFVVKKAAYAHVAKRINKYISLCKDWLDITDSEFVLDPDTYCLK